MQHWVDAAAAATDGIDDNRKIIENNTAAVVAATSICRGIGAAAAYSTATIFLIQVLGSGHGVRPIRLSNQRPASELGHLDLGALLILSFTVYPLQPV